MARGVQMIVKIIGDASKFQKELNDIEKKSDASVKRMARNAKIAGAALAAATAAGVGTVAAITEFAKFEKDFTKVVTLLDDTSFKTKTLNAGIKDLSQGVLDLAGKSGQSFETLNKGLFDLISAGVAAEDSIETLRVATELALIGATDTATAVDGLTSAMNAYGLEAKDVQDVSNQFFTAQKFGKTTIAELSDGFGQVGTVADQLGVSLEEVLATISAVTLGGVKTSEAYTGLKAAFTNILKPSREAKEEAKRLGIEFDAAALKTKGWDGFLKEITTSAKFTDDSINKLFSSSDAYKTVAAIAGDNSEAFAKTLDALKDKSEAATTAQNALKEASDDVNFQFNRLKGELAAATIELGNFLSDALNVAGQLKFLSDSIANVRKEVGLLNKTKSILGIPTERSIAETQKIVTQNTIDLENRRRAKIEKAGGFQFADFSGAEKGAESLAQENLGGILSGAKEGDTLQDILDRQKQLQDAQNQLLREGLEEQTTIRAEAEAEGQEQGITKDVASQTEDQFEETAETQEERLKRLQEARDKAAKAQIKSEQDLTKETEKEKEKRIQQAQQEAIEKTKSNLDYIAGVIDSNTALGKALKVYRIASAIMAAYDGATRALSDYPAPYSYAVAATTLGAGLANVASIRGVKAQRGGVVPGLGAGDRVPAMLEAGEIVVPKKFNPLSPDFETTFGGGIGGGQVNVMIGIEPDASRIITARQVEDQKLGISR